MHILVKVNCLFYGCQILPVPCYHPALLLCDAQLGSNRDSGSSGAVGLPLFYEAGDAEQSSEMPPALG